MAPSSGWAGPPGGCCPCFVMVGSIPLYQDRLRVRARASTGLRVAMIDLDDFKA